MAGLPLWDIQGLIVRGYGMPHLGVFPLKFEKQKRGAAANFLRGLVGSSSQALQVTDAASSKRRDYCLSIGFTYKGLEAIGLSHKDSLTSFPEESVAGAAARAESVGDTGASHPKNWDPPFNADRLHALVFLYATEDNKLASMISQLRHDMGGGFSELSGPYKSAKLPDDRVHFGYRDGLAQPAIEGVPRGRTRPKDILPPAKTGDFLLGYRSQFDLLTHPVPQPHQLGKNGSFAAFRLLHQDCDEFEAFLDASAKKTGLDRELIAAKLCGRWRNGLPLSLSPHNHSAKIPQDEWNSFDHDKDPDGVCCPIGSHIRRMNPRRSPVAGGTGLKRRIIRRGMPFGPAHTPGKPDGIPRGLLGLFICASLKDQFEFIMSEWTNRGGFAAGLRGTRDPIHGDNTNGTFPLPTAAGGTVELTGLSRFVTCKGAAYCFLPSLTGIDYPAQIAAHP